MVQIQGDRALSTDGEDRLGFQPIARRLAEALAVGTSPSGLVVGVTGRWGSGKTSLLSLTQAALTRRELSDRPHVVEFKPWLVGDRDALLEVMFGELIAGIDRIELDAGDATGVTIRKAERAAKEMRKFAGLLVGTGQVVKAAAPLNPGLAIAGTMIERLGESFKTKEISLARAKEKVCKRLRNLDRTLVVIVDDVDRLEPAEIVEVLRLIRSVADFPNITYVLSYDQDIVAHAVQVAAKVKDGHAYIEKIVQITLPVPPPEAFDLRRWFQRELTEMGLPASEEAKSRIGRIIDSEGGRYLRSPRAVVRTLDSIRFYWAALDGDVDLSDFVWLQFVKVGNPALYDWIAVYLTEISARAYGRAHIPDVQLDKARTSLETALGREGANFAEVCGRLADHLPGVAQHHELERQWIFLEVDSGEVGRAISARRLSSPDHYRLYFAFAQPSNVPSVKDFDELRAALLEGAHKTETLLRQWSARLLTSGVSQAEVMFDRLSNDGLIALGPVQAENLLVAYSTALLLKTESAGFLCAAKSDSIPG